MRVVALSERDIQPGGCHSKRIKRSRMPVHGPAVEWQVGSCAADAPTLASASSAASSPRSRGGLLPSEMATGSLLLGGELRELGEFAIMLAPWVFRLGYAPLRA